MGVGGKNSSVDEEEAGETLSAGQRTPSNAHGSSEALGMILTGFRSTEKSMTPTAPAAACVDSDAKDLCFQFANCKSDVDFEREWGV
jgi:hypothetical protein